MSFDLHHHMGTALDCGGTYDGPDSLGYAALLADHSSYIVLCYVEMVDRDAFFIGFIDSDADGILVFDKSPGHHFKKLFKIHSITPFFLRSTRTVSVG